jgi:hypothetical protein
MEKEPSEYVIAQVREKLATIGELSISIDVVDDSVYLGGIVATEKRKADIGDVVADLLPGRTVHNEVEAEELHTPTTAENIE